jgi:uncharacterized phage protein (TIGR02218 family)
MKQEITGNTAAALAVLATRQFFVADAYTISGGQMAANFNNVVLRYTGADRDIAFNGNTYLAGGQVGPYWDRKDNKAKLHWKASTDIDQFIVDVLPGSATVGGVPFLTAIRDGVFDGCEVEMDRLVMAVVAGVPTPPVYGFVMFAGRIAEADAGRSFATFTINSHLELFNQNMPRDLVQTGCINTLYDINCTLLAANFQASGTVSDSNSTGSVIDTTLSTTLTLPLGKITFDTGANAGFSRTIRAYTPSVSIQTINPFPTAPAAGDAFHVNGGCNKTQFTCQVIYNNFLNYRGFDFTPVPETGA